MLQRAIKSQWGMEVRQVLFFTVWTLFQRVRLLLRVDLGILLRKEEVGFFPLSICFFEEKLRLILCPILASLFQVKGQKQHKGAVKALIHLWDEFSSTGVAAAM